MYITSKPLLIYCIWTQSNHDPCTSLKYDLVWNFLCSPYGLSVYFAKCNNTVAICCSRPWHDLWVIAWVCAIICASQEYLPCKIQNGLSRIHFNWFNLILLTLLFKSLFFKTNLNCSNVLLIYLQSLHSGASVNMFYQKR